MILSDEVLVVLRIAKAQWALSPTTRSGVPRARGGWANWVKPAREGSVATIHPRITVVRGQSVTRKYVIQPQRGRPGGHKILEALSDCKCLMDKQEVVRFETDGKA